MFVVVLSKIWTLGHEIFHDVVLLFLSYISFKFLLFLVVSKLLNDELFNNLPFGFIFPVVPVVTQHKASCMIYDMI